MLGTVGRVGKCMISQLDAIARSEYVQKFTLTIKEYIRIRGDGKQQQRLG